MALPGKAVELIHADIDGEISVADKRELESILAASDEACAYHAEMAELCDALNSAEELSPPNHLRHLIMDSANSGRFKAARPSVRSGFFATPAFRLATAFAAGVVLTWSFVSSDRISRSTFDDVTGLVGTISDTDAGSLGSTGINISHADIAGTISLRKSGRLLVIDFDLVSNGPMDVVAGFAKTDVWFNGFAQTESSDTSVAAEPGRVTIRMGGKSRYALYLHDSGSRVAAVDLQFVSSGIVVHEARLVTEIAK